MGQANPTTSNELNKEISDFLEIKKSNLFGKALLKVIKENYTKQKLVSQRSLIETKIFSNRKKDVYCKTKACNLLISEVLTKLNMTKSPNPSLFNCSLAHNLVKQPAVPGYLRIGFLENQEIFSKNYKDFISLTKENNYYSNQIAYLNKLKLATVDQFNFDINISKLDLSTTTTMLRGNSNLLDTGSFTEREKAGKSLTKSPKSQNIITSDLDKVEMKNPEAVPQQQVTDTIDVQAVQAKPDVSDLEKKNKSKEKSRTTSNIILITEGEYKKIHTKAKPSNLTASAKVDQNKTFTSQARGRNVVNKGVIPYPPTYTTYAKTPDKNKTMKGVPKTPITKRPVIKIKLTDLKKEQVYAEKNTELILKNENEKLKSNRSFNKVDYHNNQDPFDDIYTQHMIEEEPMNKTDIYSKHVKGDISMFSQANKNKSHYIKKPLLGKYKVINKNTKLDNHETSFIELVDILTRNNNPKYKSKSPFRQQYEMNKSLVNETVNEVSKAALSRRINQIMNKKKNLSTGKDEHDKDDHLNIDNTQEFYDQFYKA